jgi:hypothetical protein
MEQGRDPNVDGIPERRRPFGLEIGAQNVQQLIVIRREIARIDLNSGGEAAYASTVGGEHGLHELLRGLLDELELCPHTAAAVQQHHNRNRLDVVHENGQLLALAVVVNLEHLALEVWNQTPPGVSDSCVDRDRAIRSSKRGSLLRPSSDGDNRQAGEGSD